MGFSNYDRNQWRSSESRLSREGAFLAPEEWPGDDEAESVLEGRPSTLTLPLQTVEEVSGHSEHMQPAPQLHVLIGRTPVSHRSDILLSFLPLGLSAPSPGGGG